MLLSNRDSDIQKYIPLLYTTLWDYCLLYKKPSLDCIVIPHHDGCTYAFHCFPIATAFLLDASITTVYLPDVFPRELLSGVDAQRQKSGIADLEVAFYSPVDM